MNDTEEADEYTHNLLTYGNDWWRYKANMWLSREGITRWNDQLGSAILFVRKKADIYSILFISYSLGNHCVLIQTRDFKDMIYRVLTQDCGNKHRILSIEDAEKLQSVDWPTYRTSWWKFWEPSSRIEGIQRFYLEIEPRLHRSWKKLFDDLLYKDDDTVNRHIDGLKRFYIHDNQVVLHGYIGDVIPEVKSHISKIHWKQTRIKHKIGHDLYYYWAEKAFQTNFDKNLKEAKKAFLGDESIRPAIANKRKHATTVGMNTRNITRNTRQRKEAIAESLLSMLSTMR